YTAYSRAKLRPGHPFRSLEDTCHVWADEFELAYARDRRGLEPRAGSPGRRDPPHPPRYRANPGSAVHRPARRERPLLAARAVAGRRPQPTGRRSGVRPGPAPAQLRAPAEDRPVRARAADGGAA